jgi:RNA polymerase sigma-70 factor (ECF subfamily)
MTRQDDVERLRRAILGLPSRYREVVVLCDLEDIPYAAAAESLRCPVGTVRSRLHRARRLLAAALAMRAAPLGKGSALRMASPLRCTV